MGCGRRSPASALVRFVRDGEGNLRHGPRLPGRGAWLCAASLEDCAANAGRRRAFERSLRGPIVAESIDAAVAAARSVRPQDQNARG